MNWPGWPPSPCSQMNDAWYRVLPPICGCEGSGSAAQAPCAVVWKTAIDPASLTVTVPSPWMVGIIGTSGGSVPGVDAHAPQMAWQNAA